MTEDKAWEMGGVPDRKKRYKVRIYALFLFMLSCAVCGCTRREQLVLEAENAAVEEEAEQSGEADSAVSGAAAQTAQNQDTPEEQADGKPGVRVADASGQGPSGETKAGDAQRSEQSPPEEMPVICVHVCGAVRKAGVYELPAGSRVFEAVKEAGGFTAEADESYVNQAQRLTDGAKLVIPTREQVENATAGGEGSAEQLGIVEQTASDRADGYGVSVNAGADGSTEGETAASDGKININTASEAQLCEIPGIGATRAAAIVAYRQESGGFGSIEDIMNVSGIKEGTYAKIKDRIKVN